MASITAVEFGAGTCAFARTSVRKGAISLSAAEILDPAAFPGIDAFTVAVRQTRRTHRLPRRCRVVVWGLPEGANRNDPVVKPLLEPLTGAGFWIERVVSPCNALSALARVKTARGEGSTCWLAINRGGVAIVVVRSGAQLYAHSFAWDSSVGATGSQARLLQRYSQVSFLAPEVKRAMAAARTAGTPVDAVVTCGNLPDLRSLTMPLIDELDVEVETLDSLEGLVVTPQVAEKLSEWAPALRLACAAAIARGTRPLDESKRPARRRGTGELLRAAALTFAIVGIAAMWYVRTRTPLQLGTMPHAPQAKAQTPVSRIEGRDPKSGKPGNEPRPSTIAPRPPAVSVPAPAVSVPAKKPESNPATARPGTAPPASRIAPRTTAVSPRIEDRDLKIGKPGSEPRSSNLESRTVPSVPRTRMQPLLTVPSPNVPAPSAPHRTATVAERGEAATGRPRVEPRPSLPDARIRAAVPPAASVRPPGGLNTTARAPGKAEVGTAVRLPPPEAARIPPGPMPPLLKDAFPRVTAILVATDRRFATLDGGQIVGIGDLLGRRTVIGMDERSVVFQEPSGLQIRIGLGGRLLGVERGAR
jgi:hypothetical protein